MNIKKIQKIPSVFAAVILIGLWIFIFVIRFHNLDLTENTAFHRENAGWIFAFIALFSGSISGLYRPWRWYSALLLYFGFFSLHYLQFPVILNVRGVLGILLCWWIGWFPGVILSRIVLKIYCTMTEDFTLYETKQSEMGQKEENNEDAVQTK